MLRVFIYLISNFKQNDEPRIMLEYTLNAAGEAELRDFWERWGFITAQLNKLKEN